jgi:hypothetical protein
MTIKDRGGRVMVFGASIKVSHSISAGLQFSGGLPFWTQGKQVADAPKRFSDGAQSPQAFLQSE